MFDLEQTICLQTGVVVLIGKRKIASQYLEIETRKMMMGRTKSVFDGTIQGETKNIHTK